MEGIQGAVLDVKLRHLDDWNAARGRRAAKYTELLADVPQIRLPVCRAAEGHVWHLFVVLVPAGERDKFRDHLNERGIASGIHYPTPVPLQPAYAALGHKPGDFPVAEDVMARCVSLPMFPELADEQIQRVAAAVREYFA
jgi:dTDP-4-amino-4,6-dideoxygalactose transaminase